MKDFRELLERLEDHAWLAKQLVLSDGEVISVQASQNHYATPRADLPDYTCYVGFEVGYPSFTDERLLPYAEDPENPTKTVYGYVPFEIIQQVINDHGGVSDEHI